MSQELALSGVTVSLGGREIVRDISATLEPGTFAALIGPNGAGKTTLLRALAGLIPAAGGIRLGERDLAGAPPDERARLISYLPQGHHAHWPLPARDIVALGRYPHGVRDPSRLPPADKAIVDDALRRTDAAAFADRNIQTLSGGERARVMMARVFAVKAPVLLADEPTAALDPRHQIEVMAALRGEARRGAIVIAVTHDITLAARFSDKILLMKDGTLAAAGPVAEVLTEDALRDVYRVDARFIAIDGGTVVVPWAAA
ncbi:MAG: ABC transporter ATP-binding protein [Beijerinckiaceae bacterium]